MSAYPGLLSVRSSLFRTISTATLKKYHVITIYVLSSCWLFGMRDKIEGCAKCKFWPFICLPDSTALGNILVRSAGLFNTIWRGSLVTYISAMRATGAASLPLQASASAPSRPSGYTAVSRHSIDIPRCCRHIRRLLSSQRIMALLLASWPT